MAEEQVPPLPPTGEIVSTAALYNTQISLYRNTLAFGGQTNPSTIWSSMLRDDGTAMLYYRELEEKDTDVANALDELKDGVLELDYSILPFDDSSEAADVAQFIKEQLANVPDLDGVLDNMLDSAGYGFSVSEMQFDVSMGQASLQNIKDCPQELFLFADRFSPQIGNLQFLNYPQASSGTEVPEQKFIVYSNRPRSRNRMGRPLLRSVFWSSWFKRNMLRLWVQYGEKGPGTAVVRYQDSDNPQDAQTAADLAQALIDQVAVAVPQNFEYDKELLTIARALNPDVFAKFTSYMQLDIVRRILGETLTSFGSEGGNGSRSMGDTHTETKKRKAIRMAKATQSCLNRQLIRPLVLWNFGPDAPMPRWQFDVEEPEDLIKRQGLDAGLQRMGVPIPLSYARNRYEIPTPEGDEPVLVPNVNGPNLTVTDNNRAIFSEGTGAQQAVVDHDQEEYDRVMAELRGESIDLYQRRIREVASAIKPSTLAGK